MNVTLSLLVALLWLLPGVVALIFWNQMGRQFGVRRPDQPLTAINGIALALGVSLAAHVFGVAITELLARIANELGWASAGSPYRTMAQLMTRPTAGPNAHPIDVSSMGVVLEFIGVLAVLCALVGFIFTSRGLTLAFDGLDVHGLGWAYQHVTQPKSHGYAPVAFVLTTAFEEKRGLGYAGGIADIRLDDTGEVKAIALSEPERFVYNLGTSGTNQSPINQIQTWFTGKSMPPPEKPSFEVIERAQLGGAIHLPADVIRNILVLNFLTSELEAEAAAAPDPEGQANSS